ncbi:MAG TPA: hypothetical protein VHF46_01345 [Rubrobacteraceae bacterium]|nr:hypothetical protein [Rubrobacteraceae bacterium]
MNIGRTSAVGITVLVNGVAVQGMEADQKVFSAIVLLVGILVLVGIGYDIYRFPADPEELGTATIKIKGTSPFQGEVGTYYGETHTYKGKAPVTVRFPYRQSDHISVDVNSAGTLDVEIRLKDRIVEKGQGRNIFLFWEAPVR